ncbi:tRNA pseudouridine synthase A [Koleobacter methoxysyntrophicus]|uniref:tRNA pseudouridine synthase A n=1 Tax=Koleobacter methoxysyntrophicus TaxID=2751313 RepID=A0A8A0RKP7_9FIRM|nr:tRNA pseudouridine(38-40) synthase TruA [Koleobacter methoxysyntrophicus]QSQ09001.1 tRNA pseudouridine synthase A [Koleobacter methoxysyntrophicus]
MQNIKLIIEYDGTNYHGWQRQKNAVTVQEKIEGALKTLTGKNIILTGAGRTDAGVHARGQVANFRIETLKIPLERLPLAINSLLPEDIAVKHAERVPEDFHSRYWAKGKVYSYYILNSKMPSPLLRYYSYHFPRPLDIEKMRRAGSYFVGIHDFSSFMASGSSVKTTVRSINKFQLDKEKDLIRITFQGDGFLYNMVRIMVGTLLEVGEGKLPPEYIPEVLRAREREKAGITLPPKGLVLERVLY